MRIEPSCLSAFAIRCEKSCAARSVRRAREEIAEHQRTRHDHPRREVIAVDERAVRPRAGIERAPEAVEQVDALRALHDRGDRGDEADEGDGADDASGAAVFADVPARPEHEDRRQRRCRAPRACRAATMLIGIHGRLGGVSGGGSHSAVLHGERLRIDARESTPPAAAPAARASRAHAGDQREVERAHAPVGRDVAASPTSASPSEHASPRAPRPMDRHLRRETSPTPAAPPASGGRWVRTRYAAFDRT